MRCYRCNKRLKKGYWRGGKVYGSECVVKMGYSYYGYKIKIKKADDDELQIELF